MARKYQEVEINGVKMMYPTELVREANKIKRWERLNEKVEQARTKLQAFEDEVLIAPCRKNNEGLDRPQKSFTFRSLDGETRLTVILDRQYMEFSHLADQAQAIILKKIETREQSAPDELTGFLMGLFSETRKLHPSEKLSIFMKMALKDRDLKRAQELLKNAMTLRRTKSYVRYKPAPPRA